jgi:hypothetical protein
MTLTQSKTEYLTEALIEQLNNREKVNSIESSRSCYTNFEYEVGRKYIKVWSYLISDGEKLRGRSCFMFVEKETGAVLKPASHRAPAKGIRFYIDFLADHPEVVDQYGSFLYLR